MIKNGLFVLMFILLLSACNDNELNASEEKELRDQLYAVIHQSGDLTEANKADIDEALSQADQLSLPEEERDWFVQYYLIYSSYEGETDKEQVYEGSQLRMLYEETWQELAFERYGVTLEEERVEDMIEEELKPLIEDALSSEEDGELDIQRYLADESGYSLEELYLQFSRHIYERRAIGEDLEPILKDEYGITDIHEVREKYRIEVIDEIVKSNS